MSSSRDNLIEILTTSFQDPALKQKCLHSCKDITQHAIAARAFDEFPSLLPDAEIDLFRKKFLGILRNIHATEFTDTGYQLVDKKDSRAIETLVKEIAAIGCAELIDINTHQLKNSIIELLQWQEAKDKIDACDILCAFVGAVNQDIMHCCLNDIDSHSDAFAAFCSHITKKYHAWSAEILKMHCHGVEPLQLQTNFNDKHTAKVDISINPRDVAIGTATAGLMVASVIGGILLFQHEKNKRIHQQNPEKLHTLRK